MRDQVEIVFALQPLLHDVHVQQAEESAAETETHRFGRFRLEMHRGVVELELVQRFAQRRIVVGDDREQAGEHARLHLLETRQRMRRRIARQRQRVADRRAVHVLDRRGDPADFAGAEFVARRALGREHADLIDFVRAAGRHHEQLVARLDLALHHAHQRDDAEIIVEPRIDDQRLQPVGVARLRRRNARDDRFEHGFDVLAGLRADRDRVVGVDADDGFDFGLDAFDVGGRQVDLVEHRHDFEAHLDRGVAIGDRLRFDALRRIDDQQRAFARGERAADFVAEVDVARRIDEIELVGVAVFRRVRQRNRLRLDGDAALALDRIVVEHLRFHLALGRGRRRAG